LKQELEQVRGATTNHHATNPDSDTDDGEHVTKKGKTSSDDHGALKSDALQAGKKYAVCNLLWLDPGVIRHVKHIAMEGSDMELSDEPEDLKEQAQNILKTLPAPLRPHVGTKWFRERVRSIHNIVYLLWG
jgi:hypothetical protein